MNIHFEQAEKKSQVVSYLLAAFAISVMVLFVLSLSRQLEVNLSVPSVSVQAAKIQNNDAPVAIPAPQPLVEQAQMIAGAERR